MTKNIYALLVGIDKYDPQSEVPSLDGCVNDILEVQEYLQERIAKENWTLKPLVLTNQNATRQNIINGFQQHLSQATHSDVALFYYAGHGGQENTPPELQHLEPEGKHETLVCYDSRTKNGWDLADKELGYLISQVSQKNPHFLVILDCCHSGSGTRDVQIKVRQVDIDTRQRTFDTFIFAQDRELLTADTITIPSGKHIAIAACLPHETAKEYRDSEGKARGAFSYFLLKTLESTNGYFAYRDLLRNIKALVSGKVKDQSPQLEGTNADLSQPFLGGAIKERSYYLTLTYSENLQSWVIDSGTLYGIPKVAQGGSATLAIFPLETQPEKLRDLSLALGEAKITEVMSTQCKVEVTNGSDRLSSNQSYYAVITTLPIEPLKIYIQGSEADTQFLLQKLNSNSNLSLFVQSVSDRKEADYYILASNSKYSIVQPTNDSLVIPPIPQNSDGASKIAQCLENLARWNNLLELESPANSLIKQDDVDFKVTVLNPKETIPSNEDARKEDSEVRAEYVYQNGAWSTPEIRIELKNNTSRRLYCNIIDLAQDFSISAPFFDETTSIVLEPVGKSGDTRIIDGLQMEIYDDYYRQGITEYTDILKLIVSTSEFNAELLEQDKLDVPPKPTRSLGENFGTLNLLMAQVTTRQISRKRSQAKYDDWMTKQIQVTTVRPLSDQSLKPNQTISLLNGAVELINDSNFEANVHLASLPQVSRDINRTILPPILQNQPSVVRPFLFSNTRSANGALSVLELTNVKNYAAVTPENPLKLAVNQTLAPGEHILPIGYDGEFFLPLGKTVKTQNGKTEIHLQRLPRPTQDSRSLQGAIKILFQKIALQKVGFKYEYPILAIAKFNEAGLTRELDTEKIKAEVANSKRILLYIHGIIGDTDSLVTSYKDANLESDYDLALTFDYENLNTTIEENARLLRDRLEAIGLGANHGKELCIISHSMGGLVSRWFIEREGGDKVVQHLVMLGTPNGGSPWPNVQDWAFFGLGVGLNQLSTVVWPAKIVAQLLEFLENNDNSLEQMKADSEIIQQLALNGDPHVQYTIIAGDRSIHPAALQPGNETKSLQRLMDKLFGKAVDGVVDAVFFHQPNDIAVTLTSIKNVNSNRVPQPKVFTPNVACDHLSYFNTKPGLEALVQALALSDRKVKATAPKEQSSSKTLFGVVGFLAIVSLCGFMFSRSTAKVEPQKPNTNTTSVISNLLG